MRALPTVCRPILEKVNGIERVSYLRGYIKSGHQQEGVPPLTSAQLLAMDDLDAEMTCAKLQMHRRLAPGEMIFFNNQTLMHGGTEYEDYTSRDQGRLLLRVWIEGDHEAHTSP